MKASISALLRGVIDYAGLFPPASLSLDQSIRNYAKYLKSQDTWMLGRFICPATKLNELLPYVQELFSRELQLPLSVLGRGGTNDAVSQDFKEIAAFRAAAGPRAVIGAFEMKAGDKPGTYEWPAASCDIYLEFPWDRIDLGVRADGHGFKLRTGGVEPAAFPSVQLVAQAIARCRDVCQPMKFTAGLHHPIRHYNESVKTKMHGFINVFVAGVLAHSRGLSQDQVESVLSDEDASNFRFEDETLRWKDHQATVSEITAARREFVTSFGSCSFDEPREDLRSLGWM